MAPNNTNSDTPSPNIDLEIPKWINEEYFEKIVEKDVPDYSKIKKFTPIAATAPGENYTSVMVRVAMNIELKDGNTIDKSYILKTELPGNSEAMTFINNLCLFPKELEMYKNVLPKLVQLYTEAGVTIQLSPKCLDFEETPERITLVMEDLKPQNFSNFDRLKGFDMPHMTAVLHKLAEFHAASATLYELNGAYDAKFDLSFFDEMNRPIFKMMDADRVTIYDKAMRQWGLDDVEYYINKMPSIDAIFDAGKYANQANPDEFNVLNHGDCWANNIMFTHDEHGNVVDTLFLDFQLGKWGSPAQDLWYVITTSVNLDIKVKEYDQFIWIYHRRLVECLNLLKYPKELPTLKDLQIMMIKYGQWGPLTANGVMTAVLLPSDKDANMENIFKAGADADSFKMRTLTNPYYIKAIAQLLPFFDRKGLLDY